MIQQQVTTSSQQRTRPFSLPLGVGVSSAHLVGICGAGMKALAEFLTGNGIRVSGSDQQGASVPLDTLQSRGVRVHRGHSDLFLPADTDLLIYSAAVGPGNPERRMASRLNIPQLSFHEMLGQLMQTRTGVSIAGTHGKSTTTAMVGTILEHSGHSPSVIVGAELCASRRSGWAGDGDLLVAESCEYQRHFLEMHPRYATILDVEPDHFDCFPDFESTQQAFADFAAGMEPGGLLVVRGDNPYCLEVAQDCPARVLTFSDSFKSDWTVADVKQSVWGQRFRAFYQGDFVAEFFLQPPGRHTVSNALAAVALCHGIGLSVEQIQDGLAEFQGIRRRFERVGSWQGITLVDDYAHHPTEIQASLATAREFFGARRLWCVFQPHQVSRTSALMHEFSQSFHKADEVLIAPIYAARETVDGEAFTVAEELAEEISRQGDPVRFARSLDQIIATIEDEAHPGDVLLTMGAGDIDQVHYELTRRLSRNHQS